MSESIKLPPYVLTCGCPSEHGGFPSQWPDAARDGSPATSYGVLCEMHFHEYDAQPAQYGDSLAIEQNTAELLKELTTLQRWYADVSMRAEKAEAEVERLREALKTAKWMLERDYIDDQKMAVIRKCEAALGEPK